jgi:hypothetical protein
MTARDLSAARTFLMASSLRCISSTYSASSLSFVLCKSFNHFLCLERTESFFARFDANCMHASEGKILKVRIRNEHARRIIEEKTQVGGPINQRNPSPASHASHIRFLCTKPPFFHSSWNRTFDFTGSAPPTPIGSLTTPHRNEFDTASAPAAAAAIYHVHNINISDETVVVGGVHMPVCRRNTDRNG